MAYQQFHGLNASGGFPEAETQRSLFEPRFCGHPDVMPMQLELGKWGMTNIRWTIQADKWPRVGVQDAKEAFALAWQQWAEVCNIQPEYTANVNTANVITSVGTIDGPQSVLAWSELPPTGFTGSMKQLFDQAEAWVVAESPQRYMIDLVRVACHEIGHVIGIPHIQAGNLMQPTYDERIRKPQAGDVQEAVSRYGQATQPPLVPSPGKGTILVEIEGVVSKADIPGFRVVRLVG
jgi:hypothetical protein